MPCFDIYRISKDVSCHSWLSWNHMWSEKIHIGHRETRMPECVSVETHSDEVESLLALCLSTLMCFVNERRESHHSPRNFVDSSTGRSVSPILTMGGVWAWDRGAVRCMTLHLWAANLKPFVVAHSSMSFTACCRCLSMVSRERPRKRIARSLTKSALKMFLAIQEGSSLIFSPKHVTARTPPVGTPSYG